MGFEKLRSQAIQALEKENYPARRLTLIHTGAMLVLSLVLTLVSFLLGQYADGAGGLSALGTQAVVGTVQMALPIITLVASPFWEAGYHNAALQYAAEEPVEVGSLLQGFRRWKPILTSSLFVGLLYLGRGFIAAFLSSQLLMFTPMAGPIYKASLQQMANPELDLLTLMGDDLIPFLVTYGVIFAIVFAVLALPVYYRYRMVNYVVMKDPGLGGLQAMFVSRGMTFRRRRALFRIDLGFWWFHLLNLLIGVVCYGDLILPYMGVELPISQEAATWVFLLISMAAQLLLYLWAKPKVEVTWAKAFEEICKNPPEMPVAPQQQEEKKHPWDYE